MISKSNRSNRGTRSRNGNGSLVVSVGGGNQGVTNDSKAYRGVKLSHLKHNFAEAWIDIGKYIMGQPGEVAVYGQVLQTGELPINKWFKENLIRKLPLMCLDSTPEKLILVSKEDIERSKGRRAQMEAVAAVSSPLVSSYLKTGTNVDYNTPITGEKLKMEEPIIDDNHSAEEDKKEADDDDDDIKEEEEGEKILQEKLRKPPEHLTSSTAKGKTTDRGGNQGLGPDRKKSGTNEAGRGANDGTAAGGSNHQVNASSDTYLGSQNMAKWMDMQRELLISQMEIMRNETTARKEETMRIEEMNEKRKQQEIWERKWNEHLSVISQVVAMVYNTCEDLTRTNLQQDRSCTEAIQDGDILLWVLNVREICSENTIGREEAQRKKLDAIEELYPRYNKDNGRYSKAAFEE